MPLRAAFHRGEPLPHPGPIIAEIGQIALFFFEALSVLQRLVVIRMPSLTLRLGVEPLALPAQVGPESGELWALVLRSFQFSEFVLMPPLTRGGVLEPLTQRRQVALEGGQLALFAFGQLQHAVLMWVSPLALRIIVEPLALGGPVDIHLRQLFLILLERPLLLLQRLVLPRMPPSTPRLGVEPLKLRTQVALARRQLGELSLSRLQLVVALRVPLRAAFHRSEPTPHLAPVIAEVAQLLPLFIEALPVLQRLVVIRMPSLTLRLGVEPLALRAQIRSESGELCMLGLDRLQQCSVVVWMPPLTFGDGLEPLVPRSQIGPESGELCTLALG